MTDLRQSMACGLPPQRVTYGMRFCVLGPLEVWDGDRPVGLGGPQKRAVLALLLAQANQVVSVDRLIDQLWPGRAPGTARSLVQGCVTDLRRALRSGVDGALVTRA